MEYQSDWTGSSFEGECKNGWFEGHGKYKFASGVVYEGQFHKGDFHGEGDLVYPNGGRYKATWVRGKATNGKYYFDDNLEYKANNWNYIIPEDRRFYAEIKGGFRPCGMALQTNKGQAEEIPYGTYNTGDGYFDPTTKRITTFDGKKVIGEPEPAEIKWIVNQCRKGLDRILQEEDVPRGVAETCCSEDEEDGGTKD